MPYRYDYKVVEIDPQEHVIKTQRLFELEVYLQEMGYDGWKLISYRTEPFGARTKTHMIFTRRAGA